MIRSQEEERGKVIDDVLVILQTLLKRTDSLQSLLCTGDLPGSSRSMGSTQQPMSFRLP